MARNKYEQGLLFAESCSKYSPKFLEFWNILVAEDYQSSSNPNKVEPFRFTLSKRFEHGVVGVDIYDTPRRYYPNGDWSRFYQFRFRDALLYWESYGELYVD